jgi:hypothetical protein
MDPQAIIGRVAARYGVLLDSNDPAFLLVEVNRAALEEALSEAASTLGPPVAQLESAAKELVAAVNASATAAAQSAASAASTSIQAEVTAAQKTAAGLMESVARSYSRADSSRWFALALLGAVAALGGVFAAGAWVGYVVSGPTIEQVDKDQARAAVELAEMGQARILRDCTGPGWTRKDGFCYGTGLADGKVIGWRIK